jgi:hypothetical protein
MNTTPAGSNTARIASRLFVIGALRPASRLRTVRQAYPVQLRCAVTGRTPVQEDLRLQCGVNIEGARELAAALLKAAQLMEDTPVVARLNWVLQPRNECAGAGFLLYAQLRK